MHFVIIVALYNACSKIAALWNLTHFVLTRRTLSKFGRWLKGNENEYEYAAGVFGEG